MRGWLFDVYPAAEGMVLWVLDEDGRPHRLHTDYHPAFYAAGPNAALDRLDRLLYQRDILADRTPAVRQELFSGTELPVVQVSVHRPLQYSQAVRQAAALRDLTLYTCDLSPAQLFLYERGFFPLGQYDLTAQDGALRDATPLSRPEDLEYASPPLVVMRLRLDGDPVNPHHGWRSELAVAVEGEEVVLSGERPEDLIRSLNRMLARYDPDVLLTEWGDGFLLPRLLRLSQRAGRPLALNRDPAAGIALRRDRSYVTYGKTVYTAGAHMLHGRWHLDLRNSFIYTESEMAGLLEIARLARLPVQRLARTSTGTAISSMQLARAVQQDILVPWHKSEPEGFKTAAELLVTDKGGLTYQPLVGVYEGVGELDFSSMYPTIMAHFNISPETINCACCQDAEVVPEIGHTVCQRRRGLVPQVLDHLLERRAYYKRRKRETTGSERAIYDQRQSALKWCLVTCLEGDTIVPVKVNGQLRVAPIREVIDRFLPDGPGVLPVTDLRVFGYDERLQPIENPVRNVIKAPSPVNLLRVRLESGREIRMIPEHRCFVVEDGRLTVKRAAELREGDLIPVAPCLPLTSEPVREVNVVQELLERLPQEERALWRIFGASLKGSVVRAYPDIRRAARGNYTDKTIWNWREYGYLPLEFAPLYIRQVLDRKFHRRSSLRRERKARMYVVQANSVALVRVLEAIFELGRSADNGKIGIPPQIWNGPAEARYEPFLRKVGLLLTLCGLPYRHVLPGGMYSLEIVREGVSALEGLGWLSDKHRRVLEERLARISRVLPRSAPSLGPFVCYRVRSIEQVPPSCPFVYCFEVEKDLHGFVVSGGIFTANSFGYLGYRNARYGRIEAHESTTAYSREMLLRAKEVAESRGFRMLHALVDSMWLQKPGAGQEAYEVLAREVEAATKLPIFVEGVYNWVAFLPSRTHAGVGVPNRYMGVFEDGSTKVRGIEVRRSDVPGLVEEMQARLLQEMFAAPSVAALRARLPAVLAILEEALVRLREGSVRASDLALTATISQEPQEYRNNHPIALAARMMAKSGVTLHPGEAIQYVVMDADAKIPEERVRPLTLLGTDWAYDQDRYAELLVRAAETVLELFGYGRDRLWQEVWLPLRGSLEDETD